MPQPPSSKEKLSEIDTDADRHPDFGKAMRRIIQEADIPDGPVERLEVFFHASGEATYRVWAPRAEESEGGYLPPA